MTGYGNRSPFFTIQTKTKNKIYVASSWRNEKQPYIVSILRSHNYEVYDFRNPCINNNGFHWSDIDQNWKKWSPSQYRKALNHPIANSGFELDFNAMSECNVFLGVQPFGRSASIEMGWAAAQENKTTILLLDNGEPELMVKLFEHICIDIDEVLEILKGL